ASERVVRALPRHQVAILPRRRNNSDDGGPDRCLLRKAAESQGICTGRHRRRTQTPPLRHRKRNVRARDGGANEARSNLANYVWQRFPVLSARPDHQLAASRPYRAAATRHRKRQRDEAHPELEELRSRKLRDFRTWVPRGLRRPFEVRFERYQKTGCLAARHDTMVEGERQWQHASRRRLTVVDQHALVDAARSDDANFRRNDAAVREPSPDHPQLAEGNP